nr:hypothetical protein [uncultured Cohaesibacter sp.]
MQDPYTFRTFSELLQFLEDGDLHQDLSNTVKEINDALTNYVIEHGGKPAAELSLKIKFKVDKGVVTITPEMSKKLPPAPRRPAMAWQTAGGFSPQNPKQMHMFDNTPRVVQQGNSDVRTVSTNANE